MGDNDTIEYERRTKLCARIEAMEQKVDSLDDDFSTMRHSVQNDMNEVQKHITSIDKRVQETTLWKKVAAIFMGISGSLATLILAAVFAGTGAFGVATGSDIEAHENKPFHDVAEVQFNNNREDIINLTQEIEAVRRTGEVTARNVSDIKATLDHAFPGSATRSATGNSP